MLYERKEERLRTRLVQRLQSIVGRYFSNWQHIFCIQYVNSMPSTLIALYLSLDEIELEEIVFEDWNDLIRTCGSYISYTPEFRAAKRRGWNIDYRR